MSPRTIFVFGSNTRGIHGLGSAAEAMRNHGAKWGVGSGLTGESYAIPTKDGDLLPLELSTIHKNVRNFLKFANNHPDWRFNTVKIGCGLAGYMEEEIKPFFEKAPVNVNLPKGWRAD